MKTARSKEIMRKNNERRTPRKKKFAEGRTQREWDAVGDTEPSLVLRFSLSIFLHSPQNGFKPDPI
jgi:hypothetical protein